jgi:aliphatic nitrilase
MNWPISTGHLFKRLYKEAVEIPSKTTDDLCNAARMADTYVVMGVTEKVGNNLGALWNTNIIIDRRGTILGKCRKLVATMAEKLVWGNGDGSAFKVYDTDIGKLGTLICGNNANSLARFAMIAQGEQVHVANYPAFPMPSTGNMEDWIKLRAKAHCHEGKLFTLVPTSTMSQEMYDMLWDTEEKKKLLGKGTIAYSGIFGPDAKPLAEIVNKEGIIYADIDIEEEIYHKQFHDIVNQTTRPDVLSLNLNIDEDNVLNTYSRKQECGQTAIYGNMAAVFEKFTDALNQNSTLLRQMISGETEKKTGKSKRSKK